MTVKRFDLGDVTQGQPAPAAPASSQPAATEAQVLAALDEWEEDAAYRLVRHAATLGACYTTSTICLVADTFDNQRLTDDLITNRLTRGGYTAAELNPLELGAPSVCDVASVDVLKRLLREMRGTFTPEQARHFSEYHMVACDDEAFVLVADRTSFTEAQRREFLEIEGVFEEPADDADDAGGAGVADRPGSALIASLAGAVIGHRLAARKDEGESGDAFPDVRSDYGRRVWADDHDFSADGDDAHNFGADGDYPV